ncbi:MAG: TetR/AcrR family transcriptional regulator [Pseudomonadota bacterium]|nr:TetR/AcrR family transcriptional regulator [Pseudomonadota bacterium]
MTQAERRERAEKRMLRAAVGLIAEKGLAGLTLNEIGEAAGYSRGLAAHYFGRRDDMLQAVVRHISGRFTRSVPRKHPAGGDGNLGLEPLIRICEYYLESVARDPVTMRALLVILTEATMRPEVFPDIVELNRSSVAAFARHIEAGQTRGEIRKDVDATGEALLVLGQIRGTVALWLADPAVPDVGPVKQAMRDSFVRRLSA